ncbi:MAG: hypothetical protein HY519_00455 [Candidatus Aenigmarchaeota archaeon]|nr:hypothetical protein [Candidatus Aenigmarchaeota archaeon]
MPHTIVSEDVPHGLAHKPDGVPASEGHDVNQRETLSKPDADSWPVRERGTNGDCQC